VEHFFAIVSIAASSRSNARTL